ncbi:MAG: glycoside hydrolase family 3 C-terminal domain-containing protein [Lachnospiraceae bacterium]|nr:glycoside hydrolase family 3 C-terminal domain-containing protein [Lachnospiraceae bacterium]
MKIKELIDAMTLKEKASLLSGDGWWKTKAIDRLGIPSVYVSDGPHGLRIQDGFEANINDSRQAVCFPSGTGLASSFNREMIAAAGKVLGNECKNEMVDVVLGPAINIKRSPLCGRNFEYMSEDPYLTGQMASAYVSGIRSTGTGVSVKHFAANNQEKHRMTVSSVIDERALREIYLAAFEEIVKSAKPDTLMCSYNRINGVYSSENPGLLNGILRDEWGFDGLVMSDWGAVADRVKGVPAGLDLEMPGSNGINEEKLIEAVEQGDLEEEAIDRAVERVLRLVDMHTGFISRPEAVEKKRKRLGFDYVDDHKKARLFARESMVLLKNEGALPLKKDEKILFVGEFAKNPRIQGGGSSHVNCTKIISALKASSRVTEVEFVQGYKLTDDENEDFLIEEAVGKAAGADKVIVFAGLPESFESEGGDRTNMRMPRVQNRLIRELGKVNSNTVVVLHNGSPVEMPWIKYANAVLEAYLGGEACGEAVIDLLFGIANPSGKLAETFPVKLEDNPSADNFPGGLTVEYRESIFVGYRYYDKVGKEVLFPFGHGLSYTSFEYSDLSVEKLSEDGFDYKVSFEIKNTGALSGMEAAQLYVRKKGSKTFRPVQELKGFEKLSLRPGESKTAVIMLNERSFAYYNTKINDWYVEPGKYEICIGSSSRDIRLMTSIMLENPLNAEAGTDENMLPTYYFGDPAKISAGEFEILYGKTLPCEEKDKRLTLRNTLEDCVQTKWGGRIYKFLNVIINGKAMFKGEKGKEPGLIMEAPLQSMICMSNGRLTLKDGNAIVGLLNEENIIENLGILKNAVSREMKKNSEAKKALKEKQKAIKEKQKAEASENKNTSEAEKDTDD